MKANTEVYVRWRGLGALILDGIAHRREAGDEDLVPYRAVQGLIASGKVELVGTRADVKRIGSQANRDFTEEGTGR